MTTVIAGGISEDAGLDLAVLPGAQILTLLYPRPVAPDRPTSSYPIYLSVRLSALVRPGETGWIAEAPDVDGLGHGATVQAALEDLTESVEQYLEYLRDDRPELAPAIGHHRAYVELLDTPRELWFAFVSVDAPALE
jgi:predicted RNase H-like HicB family nuclease